MATEAPVRIVLDTNVVVSALVFRQGPAARLRLLWQRNTVLPLVSTATARELLRVLAYPKFRLAREEQQALLEEYLPFAEAIAIDRNARTLAHVPSCRDPADQEFLDLAQAGNAEFLVTGDRDLLELNDPYLRHMCFSVITPAEAVARWPA